MTESMKFVNYAVKCLTMHLKFLNTTKKLMVEIFWEECTIVIHAKADLKICMGWSITFSQNMVNFLNLLSSAMFVV